MQIGVVEGFFGPEWPEADRLSYAAFIQSTGGGFYIYAPKRDPHLRKKWREDWSETYLNGLRKMAATFKKCGVAFGVGISPFELGLTINAADQAILEKKLQQLSSIGAEILGLFFDDMPNDNALARTQLDCIELVKKNFAGKIVFCPSYYTPDPILEKVFGKMPPHYWSDISRASDDIAMAWTGPKVISPEISCEHLNEVNLLLKRRPFVWENIFANDGPKNCKFLKLRPFTGREKGVADLAEAFAFNMMNQANLSKILFLSSRLVLEKSRAPEDAFKEALQQLCPGAMATFILDRRSAYFERGLDQLSDEEKAQDLDQLQEIGGEYAAEITDWLKGKYLVGPECLTD